MIFAKQANLTWKQVALIPVALPVLVVGAVALAVPVVLAAAVFRIRNGFWAV